MEKVFYCYSIVYIAYIIKNFIVFCQNKMEKEPIDVDLSADGVGNLKKGIKPDFIIFILNSIWISIGFFTCEKMWFLLLSVTSILLAVATINKEKKETSRIFITQSVLKTIIIICILYVHFLKP